MSPRLTWRDEPSRWRLDREARCLRIEPDAATDFWQRTRDGFEADNGHFLHLRATGDFVLTTKVTSHPVHQYDQAGLMVRISPACWVKTSVEFEPDDSNRLGAVVTNAQYSDWSTQPVAKEISTVWFRVRAEASDCIVEASLDGQDWQQVRVARLLERPSVEAVACGLYACSPKAAGYEAEFSFLSFQPGRRPWLHHDERHNPQGAIQLPASGPPPARCLLLIVAGPWSGPTWTRETRARRPASRGSRHPRRVPAYATAARTLARP